MVVVNNASELTTQLNNATGGELIELAAGVNFGRYTSPGGKTYTTAVTIQSQNPSNRASFEKLQLNSGNLLCKGFNINYVYRSSSGDNQNTQALITFNARSITFDDIRLIGNQTDGGGEITGWAGDFQGFGVSADDITLRNSYVEGFSNGIRLIIGSRWTVENVEFNAMGGDCLDPTGVKTATFRKIYGHDWQTPRSTAHIDCIQLLRHAQANAGGCEDVLIDQCVFDQANGFFQQGIWAGGDGADLSNDHFRHKRITIRDSKLVLGHANGIGMYGCDTLLVQRCMILPGPFARRDTQTGGVPVMNMGPSNSNTGVTIEDTIYCGTAGGFPAGTVETNNYVRVRADIGGSDIPAPNVGDVNGFNDYQIASGALESGGRQAGPRIANRIGGWVDAGIAPHAVYQAKPAGFQGAGSGLPVMPAGSVAAQITRG